MAVLFAAGACNKGPGGGAKKIPRDSDAQPVVVVDTPAERVFEFSREAEPNNQLDQATALAPGAGVHGSLDGETDVDVYAVPVTEAGVLQAQLSGIEGVDLILELRDADGQVLARSDRGPALVIEGIPNFAVAPATYHLAVSEFVKKRRTRGRARNNPPAGRAGRSPDYQLTVTIEPAPDGELEIEPNETLDRAAEILIGESVRGYLGWAKDVDVWKLSIEGFAPEYSLDLDLAPVPGVTPTLTARNSAGEVVLVRAGVEGEGLSVRNLVVVRAGRGDGAADGEPAGRRPSTGARASAAEKPAGGARAGSAGDAGLAQFYYIALEARRSNPLETYHLAVATRLLDVDDEIEPNDDDARATPLRDSALAKEGLRRAHLTLGDTDYFRMSAADEPVILTVIAKPAVDVDIELSVLAGGQTLAMADGGKARAAESLSDIRIEPGGTVFVKVAGRGRLGSDAAYELRWTVDPAGPAAPADGDLGTLDEYEGE